MRQKSYFKLTDFLTVACITSLGASLGWRAGKATFELAVDLCEAGLDQLKKKFAKPEEEKEEK